MKSTTNTTHTICLSSKQTNNTMRFVSEEEEGERERQTETETETENRTHCIHTNCTMTQTMTVANKVTCKELWTRSRTTEKVQLTPGSLTFCSNVVGVRWKLCSGTKYPSSNPISITRYTPSWNCGHTKSTLWKWDSSHRMPQSTPTVVSILSTSQSTPHHQTVATQNQCWGNETEVVEWHKVFLSNLNPTNFTKYTQSWNCGHRKPMLWEWDGSCGMPQSIPTLI